MCGVLTSTTPGWQQNRSRRYDCGICLFPFLFTTPLACCGWWVIGVSSVIFGTESVSKYFRRPERPKCKTDNGICRVQRIANPAIMAIQEQETSSSIPWLPVDDTTTFRASPERTFYCSCKSCFLGPILGTDFFERRLWGACLR